MLKFQGSVDEVAKVKKLIQQVLPSTTNNVSLLELEIVKNEVSITKRINAQSTK